LEITDFFLECIRLGQVLRKPEGEFIVVYSRIERGDSFVLRDVEFFPRLKRCHQAAGKCDAHRIELGCDEHFRDAPTDAASIDDQFALADVFFRVATQFGRGHQPRNVLNTVAVSGVQRQSFHVNDAPSLGFLLQPVALPRVAFVRQARRHGPGRCACELVGDAGRAKAGVMVDVLLGMKRKRHRGGLLHAHLSRIIGAHKIFRKGNEMENRQQEIENLFGGFIADMQDLIHRHRQVDGIDAVKLYIEAAERERERYARKFEALKADPSCAGLGDTIDNIEAKINAFADRSIARVKESGTIEFEASR
jgi:hypothetical protein